VLWKKITFNYVKGAPDKDAPLIVIRSRGLFIPYNVSEKLILPVLLRLADVSLVAELSHLLGLGEEFLGLVRISLLD